MTSYTRASLQEPILLFDEPGGWLRRTGSNPIIGRAAQKPDGLLDIDGAKLLATQFLQLGTGQPPSLHPFFRLRDLLGRPISKAIGQRVHNQILAREQSQNQSPLQQIRENQRRDDGGVRLDDELRRVLAELAP